MIAHGVAVGWKLRILSEVASHDLRIALYGSDAALGPQTASYTPDGEAQGAGYEAGGQALQNVSAMGNGSSVELRADDPVWPNASLVGVRGARRPEAPRTRPPERVELERTRSGLR